jgi:sulfoxide reductase heme-binding subunit YedZ
LTDPVPHLFWITSRAAGTAALVLSSVAVCLGLIMSGRRLRGRGPDLRGAHEAISLATLVAIGVHGVSLLGDRYLHPSLADISVPFASSYNTLWTTTGIVAGWATAALDLSYYARRWIGQRRWRRLHSLTAVAWLLGLVHSLGEGSDAGRLWFLAMAGIVVVPAAALLVARVTQRRSEPAESTNETTGPGWGLDSSATPG